MARQALYTTPDRECLLGLKNPFIATRYHSLVVDPRTLPDSLEVTAWTETDEGEQEAIMGLRHKVLDVEGGSVPSRIDLV